ncbi:hypothetical protein CBR_g23344 [Chara braunii]|uniref:1-phosphatidylinositol-4-phosphate 5-kinase n=1 Tax=Chara braunii TaxID=69332 RepID=A0A388L3Y0_CHABU|nr:hypothetical protein CBR_g23344 [Chara braunii]|eukprot:GBG77014.1 hypothetical protein CBR_g23344 [Chara braunii]
MKLKSVTDRWKNKFVSNLASSMYPSLLRASDLQMARISCFKDSLKDRGRSEEGIRKFPNGDRYTGGLLHGMPHGRGIYVWANGSMYEGEWMRGVKEGKGMFVWPSGASYDGEWSKGLMHGTGLYRGADGTLYRGAWNMGKKHGLGRKVFGNGDVYEGLWRDGVAEGLGRYTWGNGSEYVGEWKNGSMCGRGIFVWANGDRYDGEWLASEKHGKGVFTWPDGGCYEGTWKTGLKDGIGYYYPPGCLKSLRRNRNGVIVKEFVAAAGEGYHDGLEETVVKYADVRPGAALSEGGGVEKAVMTRRNEGVGRRRRARLPRCVSLSGPLTEKEVRLAMANARRKGRMMSDKGWRTDWVEDDSEEEEQYRQGECRGFVRSRRKLGRPRHLCCGNRQYRPWSGPLLCDMQLGKDGDMDLLASPDWEVLQDDEEDEEEEGEEEGAEEEEQKQEEGRAEESAGVAGTSHGDTDVGTASGDGRGSLSSSNEQKKGRRIKSLAKELTRCNGFPQGDQDEGVGAIVRLASEDEAKDRERSGGDGVMELVVYYDADSELGKSITKKKKKNYRNGNILGPKKARKFHKSWAAMSEKERDGVPMMMIVCEGGDKTHHKLTGAVSGAIHGAERAISGAIHGVSGAFLGATAACSGAHFVHGGNGLPSDSRPLRRREWRRSSDYGEMERECREGLLEQSTGHRSNQKTATASPRVLHCREYNQGVLVRETLKEVVVVGTKRRGRRRKKKSIKRPGESIYKGHRSYDLMVSLQLGISYTVGKITPERPRRITREDFAPSSFVYQHFPRGGGGITPPHQSADFSWKDYCPMVFRHLREKFGIDAGEYMVSLCGNTALRELSSPGKSGSVFYLSHDDKFIIKTMKKAEMQVLLRMLPHYYRHVRKYDNTLLTKFFGLHRIKPHGGRKVRFVVMGNLFCSDLRIHMRYDLKGSSLGRKTDLGKIDENTTLKDLDLDMVFKLEEGWRERLMAQLYEDCKFLEQQQIMDYSLLLGVHFRSRHAPAAPLPAPPDRQENQHANSLTLSSDVQGDSGDPNWHRRPMEHGFQGGGGVGGADRSFSTLHTTSVPNTCTEGEEDESGPLGSSMYGPMFSGQLYSGPLVVLQPPVSCRSGRNVVNDRFKVPHKFLGPAMTSIPPARTNTLRPVLGANGGTDALAFQFGRSRVQLGVNMAATAVGMTPDKEIDMGRVTDVVLYFGVIDILQEYDIRKRAEHAYKSMKFDGATISAVDPIMYSRRFQDFMSKVFT